MIMARVKAN